MNQLNQYDHDPDIPHRDKPTLIETLEAMKANEDGTANATIFYGLSGLTMDDIKLVKPAWETLPVEYRRKLMMDIAEASESNFELDYQSVGFMGLDDEDSEVRQAAIDALWVEESLEFLARLIDITQWDESQEVRAAALSALGRYILLGEYEEIPEHDAILAQETAINIWTNEDEPIEVRRRALEAISNSSHEILPDAINEAYHDSNRLMRISAVFAMGRSYDHQWQEIVLRELSAPDDEMRYEAARAAGELEIEEAVPRLGRIAVNDEREIKEVAIWSLGEIGGSQAMRILSALAEDAQGAEDESLLEAVEDAIGSASMAGGDFDFEDYDDIDD
jgi:hypothetical protein